MRKILIAGLGNPGIEYARTRHNAGFMAADRLAKRLNAEEWRSEKKAKVAIAEYGKNRLLIIKPRTYMNLSGDAVLAFVSYYKIPLRDLLVIVDDMALPFGKIRFRAKGSDGGHNGLSDIIEKLGVNEFPRLRIGIDSPPKGTDPAKYVLSDFSSSELAVMNEILDRSVDGILTFVDKGIDEAMNLYN